MRVVKHLGVSVLLLLAAGCGGESTPQDEGRSADETDPPVIQVAATHDPANDEHLFWVDHDTVQSGWTTFRFINASPVLHFVFLDHLPGDRTSEDLLREVSPMFQRSADLVREGRENEALAPFDSLPPWFGDLVFRGGSGFTSPGLTSEATIFLEPGNYVLECYIKTEDGIFHWNRGMHADLHVTADESGADPPRNPTVEITTTAEGLRIEGQPVAGTNVVAVHFQEERQLIGRDVHVARLDSDSNRDEIVAWMDFNRAEGLVSTADDPAPTEFVGGIHDLPSGTTGYFTVDLEPGEYAWVSEYAATAPGTFLPFTVREP